METTGHFLLDCLTIAILYTQLNTASKYVKTCDVLLDDYTYKTERERYTYLGLKLKTFYYLYITKPTDD